MSSEKTFDICICSTGEDALQAELIRDSILRYRLPKGTAPADPSLSYDRICLDASGAPLNEETCALQDASRYLLLLCSPSARVSAAISDRLVRFREKNGRDKITLFVETPLKDPKEKKDLEKQIKDKIKSVINVGVIPMAVEIGDLPRSEKKSTRVFDYRY